MQVKDFLKYLLAIVLLAIFSKEFLLVDEELVLITAFLLFVVIFYNSLTAAVSEALDERIIQVKELFLNVIKLKKANLLINRQIIIRVSSTSEEIVDLLVFVRHKLYDIDSQWNSSFQLLLNYVYRLYLNLIIQEELDLLYLTYFKAIGYLFSELPNWIEKSADSNHSLINDLGISAAAVDIQAAIAKLLHSNNNASSLNEQNLLRFMYVIFKQAGLGELELAYFILDLYLLNLGE